MKFDKDKIIKSASAHEQAGAWAAAKADYERLAKHDPSDIRSLLKIADLELELGNTEVAIAGYLKIADHYANTDALVKAVAVYKRVLTIDPEHEQALVLLAPALEQVESPVDAAAAYQQLAHARSNRGDVEGALQALAEVVRVDPGAVAGWIRLAEARSAAGQTDAAVEAFDKAAELLKSLGRTEDMIKVAERLLYHKPDHVEWARSLALLYLDNGNPRSALSKLQLAYKVNIRDLSTLELLARTFLALGQEQKATSVWKEVQRIGQEDGDSAAVSRATRALGVPSEPNTDIEAIESSSMGRRPTQNEPAVSHVPVVPTGAPGGRAPAAAPNVLGRMGGPEAAKPAAPALKTGVTPPSPRPSLGRGTQTGDVPPAPGGIPPVGAALGGRGLRVPAAPTGTGDDLHGGDRQQYVQRLVREGEMYLKYGLKAQAVEHLNHALRVDPACLEARERLISTLIDMKELEQAEQLVAALPEVYGDELPARALRLRTRVDGARGKGGKPGEQAPAAKAGTAAHVGDVRPGGSFRGTGPQAGPQALAGNAPGAPQPTMRPAAPPRAPLRGPQLPPRAAPQPPAGSGLGTPRTTEPGATFSQPARLTARRVEEILEEIDELLEQDRWSQAHTALRDLALQHPSSALIRAKLRSVEEALGLSMPSVLPEPLTPPRSRSELPPSPIPPTYPDAPRSALPPRASSVLPPPVSERPFSSDDMLEAFNEGFDSLFSEGASSPLEATAIGEPAPQPTGSGAHENSDYENHFNMGTAYREMELYDDAIRAFEMSAQTPERECASLTMIGLCLLDKGEVTRAIHKFKDALYAPQKTPHEELGLYYELGSAYELSGDVHEALFYLRKVARVSPSFRDVRAKIQKLENGGPSAVKRRDSPDGGQADAQGQKPNRHKIG